MIPAIGPQTACFLIFGGANFPFVDFWSWGPTGAVHMKSGLPVTPHSLT